MRNFHRLIQLLIRDLLCWQESEQPHLVGCMNTFIRLLAELFSKEQSPPACNDTVSAGTAIKDLALRWLHQAQPYFKIRRLFFTGTFNFHQLSWVTHGHLKGKLFLFLTVQSHRSKYFQELKQDAPMANTNVSTRTALDTC